MSDQSGTLAGLLAARADDAGPGLLYEDKAWTWREYVAESRARAAWLATLAHERSSNKNRLHLGVLYDNVPELVFLLGGAALAGHVVVALNPTRGPDELARDAQATDVDFLAFDPAYAGLADALGVAKAPPLAAAPYEETEVDPDTLAMLIFTSGTSGRPRAVRITQRKIAIPGVGLGAMLTPADRIYCSMPLFHSGAIMAAYAPAVASGAALVLRRRFSASGLIGDVRRYGCTYLHYVGKALSYVLATPPQPDDRDNPLKIAFGNEGSTIATKRFGERFGCYVIDAFGSTETAISVTPDPTGPPGSLGRLPEGVEIRDPITGKQCPPALIEQGRLLNADEAIGELVNTAGLGLFDGYYNDPEADAERIRQGTYWSGDFAYADAGGYVYFAGRGTERLRVDGENMAVAPIEAAIREFPGVVEAAVYPVPDAAAGDQIMAAMVLSGGFDAGAFAAFLAGRADLGAKAIPRYVRITDAFPMTPSSKVIKRLLVREGWRTADPVWWRPPHDENFRPITPADVGNIEEEFRRYGRAHLLNPMNRAESRE
ncbi:AMP-binding protein [Streptosporangiaceae bacterium NEAU-GS5]|nr:AMP-binding protein [Streptosporangiaceae bacterium NEAU-GS5]